MFINIYRTHLKQLFPQSFGYITNNELIFKISSKKFERFMFFLKHHTHCQYKMVVDACCVDYPEKKNRFELVYNLLSIFYNKRISVTVAIDELNFVSSVVSLFKSANWVEREIWDMFGVFFYKHPDLRRIITDYGFKGHPLRKDFPLTGFFEINYDFTNKRVIYTKASLMQQNKIFIFNNQIASLNDYFSYFN